MGIPVCITPRANYQSVAEHALSMMLALAKNLPLHDKFIKAGAWGETANPGTESQSKCLGIIGVGRIGRRLGELVQPLDMRIIGYDPHLPAKRFPGHIRPLHDSRFFCGRPILCPFTVLGRKRPII